MAAPRDELAKPPDAIPDAYKDKVAELRNTVLTVHQPADTLLCPGPASNGWLDRRRRRGGQMGRLRQVSQGLFWRT